MTIATLYGLGGAVAIGLGLYGLMLNPRPLRRTLAANLVSGGVFLIFGVVARRGQVPGLGNDPVPEAVVITGMVVAFAATTLAIALLVRLVQVSGSATLSSETAPPALPTPAEQ